MKFLFTCSFYPPYSLGGDGVHVKYLAEALVKKGHQVYVLTSLDAYRFKRDDFNKKIVEDGNVKVFRIKTKYYNWHCFSNYTFSSSELVMEEFKRLINEIKPDVVHHHNISLLGWNILKKIGNYKNIYTAHDYWLICPKYDLLREFKECKLDKNCFFCCFKHKKPYQFFRHFNRFKIALDDLDLVIAPSEFMAKRLKNFKVKTILNFVSNPKKTNHSKFKNYYLFMGALEHHKGILDLIDLFKETNKKLIIAGSGTLENKIKKKLDKNIFFIGWIEGKKKYSVLKNAKALLLPSKWPENMPLVALESLSYGVPVFGSNYGGIPEIIEKFKDKPYFTKNNFFRDLKKIEKIRKKECIEIYKKYFSKEAYLKKYYDAIS